MLFVYVKEKTYFPNKTQNVYFKKYLRMAKIQRKRLEILVSVAYENLSTVVDRKGIWDLEMKCQ